MKMVNTVTGPVSSDTLGVTLMHEHVTYGYTGYFVDDTIAPFDREAVLASALKRMEDIKACGVKTFVDATTNDSGRDPLFLKELSEKSGVNIVCSTGLYREEEGGSPYFKFRSTLPMFDVVAEIAELFEAEITRGIGKTGVKAGVLKVATGHGSISPYEEKCLRAAGRVQKATGVPIITHTESGTMGPEQVDILVSEGANPKQIMSGHAGGRCDFPYHLSILDKGVYLAFDRLGIDVPPHMCDAWRKGSLIGLIGLGYAKQLMMSHDSIIKFLGRPMEELLAAVMPNYYPTHVFKNIIPALKEAGVTDDTITTIMQDNPRRLFAGE